MKITKELVKQIGEEAGLKDICDYKFFNRNEDSVPITSYKLEILGHDCKGVLGKHIIEITEWDEILPEDGENKTEE